MLSFVRSKWIIILSYFLEIALLGTILFTLSTNIHLIPWYKSLTTYILLDLLILVVIQFFFFIIHWWLFDRDILYSELRKISLITLLVLTIMAFLSIISIDLFNILCYISCAFIIYMLYFTFRQLNMHLNKIDKGP